MTVEEGVALAAEGYAAIKAIIAAIEGAKAGTLDPATVLASIAALHAGLAANDATADAAEAAKFKAP